MSKATNDLKKILSKLSDTVQESVNKKTMEAVGEFTKDLVVKRTRLGYGVDENFGEKSKFADLSTSYVLARKRNSGLSSLTRPKKSNLTKTGQLLDSIRAKYVRKGVILITPTGTRTDGKSNLNIAQYNADSPKKRIFNRVSQKEFNQVLRFYRKTFGDLVKKSFKGSLIR